MSYQPPPPTPYGYGPPAPQQKSNALTVLWIVLGIVGAVVIGCCGFGVLVVGSDPDDDGGPPTAERQSSESLGGPSDCRPGDRCGEASPGSDRSDVIQPPPGSQDNPVKRGSAAQNESAEYEILTVTTPDTLGAYSDAASGQWVVVEIAVTNVKNRTIEVSSDDFTLLVGGNEVEVDDESFFLDGAWSYEDLSPGLRKTGTVAFDVQPSDAGRGVVKAEALFSFDDPVFLNLR